MSLRPTLLGAMLLTTCFSIHAMAADVKSQSIAEILSNYTLGNNPFYSKVIAPAKSLDMNKSDADRTAEFNAAAAQEINSVISAFDKAPEDKKEDEVAKVVNGIDADMKDSANTDVNFVDGIPSSAIGRTVLMFERKTPDITAAKVMDVLTSYRRSPKPSDLVWEYPNAQNLTEGEMKEVKASETSYMLPDASAPIKAGEDFATKKCRQIMGWRCATSLYSIGSVDENSEYFYMGSYDLKNNPDHKDFVSDGRSKNQVAGSTALFVVKQSEKWIMIYGIDASISNSKLAFTPLIEEALQKDFNMLQERMKKDLGLDKIDHKAPPKKIKMSFKDRLAKFFMKFCHHKH